MRSTVQIAIVAFMSAVLGSLSATGFWFWYVTRDTSVGRPAVGQPRSVLVRCSSFDRVEVYFEWPLLPVSDEDPDHGSLRLSGTDVISLRVTEKRNLINGLRYQYDPVIEVKLSDPAAQQLLEAEQKREGFVRVMSAYRLALQGKLIGNLDFFGGTGEQRLIFESRKRSFEELTSLLDRIPGCSLEPVNGRGHS